jgi:NADPH:quinone reductase-like Zn-dependent oxidoreductase
VSGQVAAIGEGVVPLLPGQKVCALVAGGGYAEYCLAEAGQCLPVPEALSMAEAAAIPETLFTVWHNVFERGWAREGETLLVHGGTSGIGSMAIMLGKLFDLTVIVTCGGADKCAAALAIGADHAIDYKESDFVAEVARITDGGRPYRARHGGGRLCGAQPQVPARRWPACHHRGAGGVRPRSTWPK